VKEEERVEVREGVKEVKEEVVREAGVREGETGTRRHQLDHQLKRSPLHNKAETHHSVDSGHLCLSNWAVFEQKLAWMAEKKIHPYKPQWLASCRWCWAAIPPQPGKALDRCQVAVPFAGMPDFQRNM
jgi:hypothetical protein